MAGGPGAAGRGVNELAAHTTNGLPASVPTQRRVAWQRLLDRQAGLWLAEVDACGAAGAELDQAARSTASWLPGRLRMGGSPARTARAVFGGPWPTPRPPWSPG